MPGWLAGCKDRPMSSQHTPLAIAASEVPMLCMPEPCRRCPRALPPLPGGRSQPPTALSKQIRRTRASLCLPTNPPEPLPHPAMQSKQQARPRKGMQVRGH